MIRGVIRDSLAWIWQGAKVQCPTSHTSPALPIPSHPIPGGTDLAGLPECSGSRAGQNKKQAGTSSTAGKEGLGKQGGRKGKPL